MQIKLDEKTIRDLPYAAKGQKYYFDRKLDGFGLCVGQKTKTFFLQRQRNGRTIRVKIGRHGDINCAAAREQAQHYAVQIQQGENPNKHKREQRQQQAISIQNLYDRYAESLHARNKQVSYQEYPKVLQRHVPDWLSKSAYNISRDMVAERYKRITQTAGPAAADRVFSILNAIYQHAAADDSQLQNPVRVLTDRKLRNAKTQRTNHIKPMQFSAWFRAAEYIPNEVIRLFLIFQLLNGIRKAEGYTLSWNNVDFDHNIITFPKTKNGKVHTLPITTYSRQILEHLYQHRVNEWVFPSKTSASGHIVEPKKAVQQIKENSGIDVTVHDLRRSFTAVANRLNISHYTIKKLLNHSLRNDVTAIYIPDDVDSLREPLQAIQDQIVSYARIDIKQFI